MERSPLVRYCYRVCQDGYVFASVCLPARRLKKFWTNLHKNSGKTGCTCSHSSLPEQTEEEPANPVHLEKATKMKVAVTDRVITSRLSTEKSLVCDPTADLGKALNWYMLNSINRSGEYRYRKYHSGKLG